MDATVAQEIAERFSKASSLCDESLRTIMSHESLGHAQVYGRLVGIFMGHSYTNVLAPIWKSFPHLEPAQMRTPYEERAPTLTPQSREALEKFLREARAAIDFAQSNVSANESEKLFPYGGLAEVRDAVAAIERFLACPQTRDPEENS